MGSGRFRVCVLGCERSTSVLNTGIKFFLCIFRTLQCRLTSCSRFSSNKSPHRPSQRIENRKNLQHMTSLTVTSSLWKWFSRSCTSPFFALLQFATLLLHCFILTYALPSRPQRLPSEWRRPRERCDVFKIEVDRVTTQTIQTVNQSLIFKITV